MKKPKLLYILNIAKRVNNFSYTSMLAALNCGMEFHIAGNWSYTSEEERKADEARYGIKIHQIDFIRAPYHPKNQKAYRQLKQLVQKEQYDIIHCNTPIGGVLGRVVAKRCGVDCVIYQAHGFHFYKGASKLNWLLYYPIEKRLARHTDALITINREDFALAKSRLKLRNSGPVYYVPGVGIDTSQFDTAPASREAKRAELGLKETDTVLISMGDLIRRKNYDASIRAVAEAKNSHLQYYICGKGPEEEPLKALARNLGVAEQVHFLGFRSDIKELLAAADIFLFTTKQEGLPRSMMEAMAAGLPCVVSDIRGNVDLISDGEGGYTCPPDDVDAIARAINAVCRDPDLRSKMGERNLESIKAYGVSVVTETLQDIYREVFPRVNP